MVHAESSAFKRSSAAPFPDQGQDMLKLSQVVQVSVAIFGTVANTGTGGDRVHAQRGTMLMVRAVHVQGK